MPDIVNRIDRIKKFRAEILNRRWDIPLLYTSLSEVKRVVIINSSSRSGSSLLYTLLSKLPQFYSLVGEASPFYKLNARLDRFNPHQSDRVPTERIDDCIDLSGVSRDFISDLYVGEVITDSRQIDLDGYADDLMLRFSLQWPDVEFDPATLRMCISQSLERYVSEIPFFNTESYYLSLLEIMSCLWPQINPFYYDIGTDKVALHFPFIEIPSGPPTSGFTVEEPPFVLLPPRNRPTIADLSGKTLLLKSTVDCYRMNLVERLLPNADLRIIHLTRNPAATINGIYDGWHHRGFFSHNLEHCFEGGTLDRLQIKGYSNIYPFGGTWWNFDLPEGWQNVADCELVEVCAFQWHSANTEILRYLAAHSHRSCVVHFEDIIRTVGSRMAEFERLLDFMGVAADQLKSLRLEVLPVVQSTLPPQLYRWKRRHDMISKALDAPGIREMAEIFGYRADTMDDWL
jgi:hypothetical protein